MIEDPYPALIAWNAHPRCLLHQKISERTSKINKNKEREAIFTNIELEAFSQIYAAFGVQQCCPTLLPFAIVATGHLKCVSQNCVDRKDFYATKVANVAKRNIFVRQGWCTSLTSRVGHIFVGETKWHLLYLCTFGAI